MSRGAVPTLDDARRAADAVAHLDPGLVLLYGSVADGTAREDSDLDLVLVFDDLGDYGERPLLSRLAAEAAEGAIGRRVDVRVTDRPEWRARTACVSSFERHIASCALTLRERRAGNVDWHKELEIPPTDADMAVASLDNVVEALAGLRLALVPLPQEAEAMDSGDEQDASWYLAMRMRKVCASAQTAMETGLKALNQARPGPHPGRVHDISSLVALSPATGPERRLLADALRGVDLAEVTRWREMGTYPSDFIPAFIEACSTPEYAADLANAAARLTLVIVDLMEDRLGDSQQSRRVRRELAWVVGTQPPTPGDRSLPGLGRAQQAIAALTPADLTRRPESERPTT